jgi:uncharacterized protein with HEPN domain
MISERRVHRDYLIDVLENADKAMRFVAGMTFTDFSTDEKTIYAVIRALEVIGEASKHIPPDWRIRYPAIPWRAIAGTRDKLIHEYFGVNLLVVWRTVQEDLPVLVEQVRHILSNINDDPE